MTCAWRKKHLNLVAGLLQPVSSPFARLDRQPFAVPARLLHREEELRFEAIILENEYLELTLLPQLELRVHRARLKDSDRDVFYFNPALASAYHSEGHVQIPGGLQFDTGTSDFPLAPRPCRIDDSQPGQLTLWMGESDRQRSLQWAVGIRLRDGMRAFEVEVRVHNTGKERQSCCFESCASVPWRLALEQIPITDGINRPGYTSFYLYDSETETGLLHLSDRSKSTEYSTFSAERDGFASPIGTDGANRLPARFLVNSSTAIEEPIVLEPGEGTCWKETWIPFRGTGGVSVVKDPFILHLEPTPVAANASLADPNPSLYDFSDPELEAERSDSESWTLSAASWEAVKPMDVSVSVDGRDVWTGELMPRPGGIEQVEVHLPAGFQNQPTLRLTPPLLRHPSEGNTAGFSPSFPALEAADALNADPGTFLKFVETAARHFRRGDVAQGRSDLLHGALELSPDALYPRCGLMALDLRNGVGDNTTSQLAELVRTAPLDPVVRWLETMLASLTGQEPGRPVTQFSSNRMFSQDDQEQHTDSLWLLEAGESLLALGLEEGLAPLERAAKSGLPLAAYHRALRSVETGREEEADEWLSLAERAVPSCVAPATERDYEALCAAIRLQPASPAANYYLGITRLVRGEPEIALPLLRFAVNSGLPWSENVAAIQALGACLWRPHDFAANDLPSPSDEDCAEAAFLLDRGIAGASDDLNLLLERDRLAEYMLENFSVRVERLQSAPPEVRSAAEVTARVAALLLRMDNFPEAIMVLEEGIASGYGQLLGALYVDGLLGRALSQMARWEMEAALDDIERALDFSSPGYAGSQENAHRSELLWWAGLCCHRMGHGYHARSYWQGAAAERPPVASIKAVCQALSIRALGGVMQGQGLLAETLAAAETLEAADNTDSVENIMPETEAAFCRAVALYALGDVRAGTSKLEMLELTTATLNRARWYRTALAAGLMDGV